MIRKTIYVLIPVLVEADDERALRKASAEARDRAVCWAASGDWAIVAKKRGRRVLTDEQVRAIEEVRP